MIAQVFADARQMMAYRDAVLAQNRLVADAGQFQQLRRIDCTGAENNFARGIRLNDQTLLAVTYTLAAFTVIIK